MSRAAPDFRNWAGTHRFRPRAYHAPASEAEVVALVSDAAARRTRLRAVGGGHSWSDIACTDGALVRLDRLDRVLAVDAARRRVRVGAGIRLKELNRLLPAHGLALSNLGSIAEQSVAGAIATGTHGTGVRSGNLATQVVALRLVTGAGEVLELDGERDPERFHAARVHLGCLGILTEVTLQCEPAFRLAERSFSVPFARALATLDELAAAHAHVKLWWLPHTGAVQVYASDRTTAPLSPPRPLRAWLDESLLVRGVFASLLFAGACAPPLVPSINRLVRAAYFTPRQRVERSDRIFNIAMPPIHRETEYAIPRALAATALGRLRDIIEAFGLRVNFLVELRFVAADESWMSPAYRRDTCQVGAYMRQCGHAARYFAAFEAMMLELGGRPHWGKEFHASAAVLRARYPMYDRFDELRRQLDPMGVFENDFSRRLFPSPAPAPAEQSDR